MNIAISFPILCSSSSSYNGSVIATDIYWRYQNLRHLYPVVGLKLGYLGISHDQINHDSSGAYVMRSEREGKYA